MCKNYQWEMLQYYLLMALEVGCEVKGCEIRRERKILEVHKKEVIVQVNNSVQEVYVMH